MTIPQNYPTLDADAGAGYYVSPFVPLLYFPPTSSTPNHQHDTFQPARQSTPGPPPPDRSFFPQSHHFASAAIDDAPGNVQNRTPWFFQAPPPAQSSGKIDDLSSADSEEEGEEESEYNYNYAHDSSNSNFVHPTPAPLVSALTPAPRENISEADMPVATTWFPSRIPDRVEWDDIRGGRLMWTPHPRTDELPPPITLAPSQPVTPAYSEPASLAPIFSAPLPPTPLKKQTKKLKQKEEGKKEKEEKKEEERERENQAGASAPVYPYGYTPAPAVAWLHYTPGTVPIPLLPPPAAAPAPSASSQLPPRLSSFLTPIPSQWPSIRWDAISSLPPTAGSTSHLRLLTAHRNIVPASADVLNKPATHPPTPFLRVRFGGHGASLTANWGVLTIYSPSYKSAKTAKEAEKAKPITVGEFLDAIHTFLHTQVGQSEWCDGPQSLFSAPGAKEMAKQAMEYRCRMAPGLFERAWKKGVKRVDVLGGRTRFYGAWPVRVYVSGWEVEVRFA